MALSCSIVLMLRRGGLHGRRLGLVRIMHRLLRLVGAVASRLDGWRGGCSGSCHGAIRSRLCRLVGLWKLGKLRLRRWSRRAVVAGGRRTCSGGLLGIVLLLVPLLVPLLIPLGLVSISGAWSIQIGRRRANRRHGAIPIIRVCGWWGRSRRGKRGCGSCRRRRLTVSGSLVSLCLRVHAGGIRIAALHGTPMLCLRRAPTTDLERWECARLAVRKDGRKAEGILSESPRMMRSKDSSSEVTRKGDAILRWMRIGWKARCRLGAGLGTLGWRVLLIAQAGP